jgi:hypothetical protein
MSIEILRRDLLREHYKLFVHEMSQYWPFHGSTKTVRACQSDSIDACLNGMYARFLSECMLNSKINYDPLIPYTKIAKNTEIAKNTINELMDTDSKFTRYLSKKMAISMIKDLNEIAIFINEYSKKMGRRAETPTIISKQNSKRLTLLHETVSLQINREHFDKLRKLYHFSDKNFLERVFNVLLRYETFAGNVSGLQGSVPHKVLDLLEKSFNIHEECFASPFNCHWKTYYSAFYDTDHYFGSKGSFFDNFNETEGSFEANPPFILCIMDKMSIKMHKLLEISAKKHKNLMFFVIVPSWSSANYYHRLKNSIFLQYSENLERKKHKYIVGMQHLHSHSRKHFNANVDSTYFILSSQKMYIDPKVILKIRSSFQ